VVVDVVEMHGDRRQSLTMLFLTNKEDEALGPDWPNAEEEARKKADEQRMSGFWCRANGQRV